MDTVLAVTLAHSKLERAVMPGAVGPYVTAGLALVGAGVIAATPIAPPRTEAVTANWEVRLAAATEACGQGNTSRLCGGTGVAGSATPFAAADTPNIFNVPANLFIALANVPYNFLNALGNGNVNLGSQPNSGFSFQPTFQGVTLTQPAGSVVGLTADLNYTGNWWLYSPTNVLGTDPADVPRYQALTNVLIPFPALSVPLGNIVAAIAASQLPMNVGCTGTGVGACDDPLAILSTMFDLRHIGDLFSPGGYTFPTVKDPITCSDAGQCFVKDPNGPELPWSQQNVQLDASAPFTSFYNSLTTTPDFTAIHTVTFQMVVDTLVGFANGLNTDFNPFVLGTQCAGCAPFVPNPTGAPVPGPIFTPPTQTTTARPVQEVAQDDGSGANSGVAQQGGSGVADLVNKLDVTNVDVEQNLDQGKAVKSSAAVQDSHIAGLANTPGSTEGSAGTGTAGVDASGEATGAGTTPTTPSTDDGQKDGNRAVPGGQPSGGKHRKPSGGLSDVVNSMRDSISKVTDGLKSGNAGKTSVSGARKTGGGSGSGASGK